MTTMNFSPREHLKTSHHVKIIKILLQLVNGLLNQKEFTLAREIDLLTGTHFFLVRKILKIHTEKSLNT